MSMASSDDQDEAVPHSVSNYYFVDDKDEPISFSELPVHWNEVESSGGEKKHIFLHGTTDNGLQKIYKQVTAWKFDLSDIKPEISVLSKENNWIKLQKPRKSFQDTIRTILITVHWLHFLKKNPETSGRDLWDHSSKILSLYETRPTVYDLVDHKYLILEAVRRDKALANSENKRKVYLAPVYHAMRFGCNFMNLDKLQEIVDMLHLYVQDGDMIVDFCCGANDFSCLMRKKLDETGKKCLFKNYDLLPPKNDFNFEKRDWFTICPNELATGSQLIMGLHPPFGFNASFANKFIDKALEFKPKLLVLIVPRETERLDRKETPYDLVWEDDELFVDKSFKMPGSVGENDKQMYEWNANPPPLYLWSRPDWTAKHKAIAEQHGHLSRVREQLHLEELIHGTKGVAFGENSLELRLDED